jgi:hypothetical protein
VLVLLLFTSGVQIAEIDGMVIRQIGKNFINQRTT